MDLCVAAKLVLWRIPPSRNYVGSPLLQESIVLPHHQGVECLPVYVASLEMSIGFFTGTGFPLGPRRNPVKFTSLEGREAIRTIGKVCLLQAELEWRGKGHNACQVSKMGTYGIDLWGSWAPSEEKVDSRRRGDGVHIFFGPPETQNLLGRETECEWTPLSALRHGVISVTKPN